MKDNGNEFSILKNKYYILGFIHVAILIALCIGITIYTSKNENKTSESSVTEGVSALDEEANQDANQDANPCDEVDDSEDDFLDTNYELQGEAIVDSAIDDQAKINNGVSMNSIDDFDASDWKLILVNKTNHIPENYEVLVGRVDTPKGLMKCDERVVEPLEEMMEAAKEEGIQLVITSPMRSETHQNYLFTKKIKQYMKNGYSYMEAYQLSAQAVTIPGTSEHQIGLAFDITSSTYSLLNKGFGDTDAGVWLAEHCKEYGFILRYPKDKEMTTGIEYEPWHFRYVGVDAAYYIWENNLCLEEFIDEIL